MKKKLISITGEQLRKALKDIEQAEKNGFMHCEAVFTQSPGWNDAWMVGTYSDLHAKAHPTNGRLDWGRGTNITQKNKFVDGKLVPDEDYYEEKVGKKRTCFWHFYELVQAEQRGG